MQLDKAKNISFKFSEVPEALEYRQSAAIAGSGPHDIWLLASSSAPGIPSYPVGVIMAGDGAAWRVVPGTGLDDAQGNPNATAGALWVVGADEVFVGGVSLNRGEGAVGRWETVRFFV